MAGYTREPMPIVDETVLIENREELMRQIKPRDVINSLLVNRVIDIDDFNSIKEESVRDRRPGVEKLLDRIHNSGPDGLDKFIESLKSSGYTSLAKILQESRQAITSRPEQDKPKRRFESTTNDTRCIILLGMDEKDKCSVGNYLVGAEKFRKDLDGVTMPPCQIVRTDNMVVMNTLGFRNKTSLNVAKEITNGIKVNNLSINVYILVLEAKSKLACDAIETINVIKDLFGENVNNNMIIVFTRKDDKFKFPSCLPQHSYFFLDCKHGDQEVVEKIQKEIFSEKYRNIPDVSVDWDAIRVFDEYDPQFDYLSDDNENDLHLDDDVIYN